MTENENENKLSLKVLIFFKNEKNVFIIDAKKRSKIEIV